MNKFINAINAETLDGTLKYTENGAVARDSTGNALLDFFAESGSLRERSSEDIVNLFLPAWNENKLYALKALFYTRDVLEGRGERRTFRIIAKWLAKHSPNAMIHNFDEIAQFGRWDDFYTFVETPIENEMWYYLRHQFAADIKAMRTEQSVSLLAKWLKSENTSSKESRALATKTRQAFGLTQREYRKTLSALRRYIKVVEVKMSANEWDSINYAQVPSVAMKRYRKAFKTHCPSAFDNFITKVENGEEKINAKTLYPYDLVEQYYDGSFWSANCKPEDRVIEAQWKALPDYVKSNHNVLVMADVSGSMYGRPICTSIGLAIYFAQRNKGAFHNVYMTFSDNPSYIQIKPNATLHDNILKALKTGVGYSTNLEAAFMRVLRTCVDNNVPQEDVPKAIVVVSDMEINPFYSGRGLDFISEMAKRYRAAGYLMPRVVLWNAEARNDTFHSKYSNPFVTFASGQSAAEFKQVLDGIEYDAMSAMYKCLDNKRYSTITL